MGKDLECFETLHCTMLLSQCKISVLNLSLNAYTVPIFWLNICIFTPVQTKEQYLVDKCVKSGQLLLTISLLSNWYDSSIVHWLVAKLLHPQYFNSLGFKKNWVVSGPLGISCRLYKMNNPDFYFCKQWYEFSFLEFTIYRVFFLIGPPLKMSLDWPPHKSLDWPPLLIFYQWDSLST